MRQCNYKPYHTTPAMCPKTTAQFLQSPTEDARSTWARLLWVASGPYLVLWQLMYSPVHRGRETGRREWEDRGREIRKTDKMYQSSARFFEGYLFKDSSFFLSHSWMVHQCRALNKQIPHFRIKWWLSHKSLRILICIRLQSTACTLALWDL